MDGPESAQELESRPGTAEELQSARGLEDELGQSNIEMRPKRNQIVEFKIGGIMKIGKASKVGKENGKDKNRC